MNAKLVNLMVEPINETDFCYVVCKCTSFSEAIRVAREDHTAYKRFNCPRCGTRLGIVCKGKTDLNKVSTV